MDTRREANEDGVREIRRWLLITLIRTAAAPTAPTRAQNHVGSARRGERCLGEVGGLVVEAAGFVLAVVVHF